MGRSIPSFRHLLEIERLNWSDFKKELQTKKDKEALDTVFENAKLYTSYLGNASNPIPLESIIMGCLFHNYKTLLQIDKQEEVEEEGQTDYGDIIKERLDLLTESKPQGRLLYDRTCKKWKGLIEALHKEDREILLKMIIDICHYDESLDQIVSNGNSKSGIDDLFFLLLILNQQKLINSIDINSTIESQKI